jgi:4'-phosphopantetheinyl transferase EntD
MTDNAQSTDTGIVKTPAAQTIRPAWKLTLFVLYPLLMEHTAMTIAFNQALSSTTGDPADNVAGNPDSNSENGPVNDATAQHAPTNRTTSHTAGAESSRSGGPLPNATATAKRSKTTGSNTSGEEEFLPAPQLTTAAPDISGLFPAGVLTLCEHQASWSTDITPDEREQLGDVCEKRFVEFCAGRSQARRLIAMINGTAQPLLIGDYRQPLWPADVSGSISHSDHFCAVAVAPKSQVADLGIDVETCEALDPDVVELVLTDNEIEQTENSEDWVRKLIFSIKESNYKCCYSRVRAFIDFKQCEVSLDLANQCYVSEIHCVDANQRDVHMQLKGKWLVDAGHIFSSAVLSV